MKCSGGNLHSERVRFVRSTFDWAVCSEPLAALAAQRSLIIQQQVEQRRSRYRMALIVGASTGQGIEIVECVRHRCQPLALDRTFVHECNLGADL